jgi:hypothetical protein
MEAINSTVEEWNAQLEMFPGGHISEQWPLDILFNKTLKAFMNEQLAKWKVVPNYITRLWMGEEFVGVCETQDSCQDFQETCH